MKFLPLFLILFSCASCNDRFEWDAKPYAADSKAQHLINKNGETVKCNQSAFDDFIAFPSQNIADLKAEIDRINKKHGNKKMQREIDKVFREIEKVKTRR